MFANISFLIKKLQAAITPTRNIWNSIDIVVAFDSLHNNFEAITASIL